MRYLPPDYLPTHGRSNLRRVYDPCTDLVTALEQVFGQIDLIKDRPYSVIRDEHEDRP